MEHISQIIDRVLNPTEEQLAKERNRELSYRRGYHQALNDTLDNVFALWKAGMSREEVSRLLCEWENEIGAWRVTNPSAMIPAPRFDILKAKEKYLIDRAKKQHE